jgi:hypothetical protein
VSRALIFLRPLSLDEAVEQLVEPWRQRRPEVAAAEAG